MLGSGGGTWIQIHTPGVGFPLAARAEHIQESVHDLAEGNNGASRGLGWFLGRQELLELDPEVVGDAPDCAAIVALTDAASS